VGPAPEGQIKEKAVPDGQPYAKLKIPSVGISKVVVEGTTREDLHKGPGHISTSNLAGQPGTFAISGHRTTYGGPFSNLDRMKAGDHIIVETRRATYTYRMTHRRIVLPTDVGVLDDVRGPNGKLKPTIVLTTCNPKASAGQRLIIFGDLIDTRTASR
jgi:sortase A